MEFHEAANIYPFMSDEDLKALSDDIKKHGQRVTIKLLNGKIIDGRNRYKACLLAGVTPKTESVQTSDPVSYVISLNSVRRHLTSSQLSMVGARARAWYEEEAKRRQGQRNDLNNIQANLPECKKGQARDLAGKAVGVSGKSIDHATKVLKSGTPELIKAVDQGRIAVSSASLLASEPAEVQVEAATKGKRSYADLAKGKADRQEQKDTRTRQQKREGMPIVRNPPSSATQFARLAIEQLNRINRRDRGRKEAFQLVKDWIKENE